MRCASCLRPLAVRSSFPMSGAAAALFERIAQESFRSTLSRVVVDARRARSSCAAKGAACPDLRARPQAVSGTGASGSATCRTERRSRPLGIAAGSSDHGCVIRCRGPTSPPSSGEGGTGDRAGAVARRPMPGLWRPSPAWRGESSRPGRASCPPSTLRRPARLAELLGADIPPEPPFAGHKERKG